MEHVKVFGVPVNVDYGTVGDPPNAFVMKHDWVDLAGGNLRIWEDPTTKALVIHYRLDGVTEEISIHGREVRVSNEVNSPLVERAAGPLIAHAQWDDVASFHAAAAIKDAKALLFLGPSGTGKTSTAHALTRYGYDFAADDVSVIRSTSLEFLGGPRRAWLRRSGNKVPIEFEGVCPDATVAAAIWMGRGEDYAFERVTTGIAAGRLLGSLWRLSNAPEMTKAWVKNATEIARKLPVYAFTFPSDHSGEPRHVPRLLESLHACGY